MFAAMLCSACLCFMLPSTISASVHTSVEGAVMQRSFIRRMDPGAKEVRMNPTDSSVPREAQEQPGKQALSSGFVRGLTTASRALGMSSDGEHRRDNPTTTSVQLDLSPPIAAIIPTWPPKFDFFSEFLKSFVNCSEAHNVLTVMPILSKEEDKELFIKRFGRNEPIVQPLVASVDADLPPRKHLASWKKLDGLAQVLSMRDVAYRYVLLMDDEILLNGCSGFANLTQGLDRKMAGKVWYGSPGDYSWIMASARCSVVACDANKDLVENTATSARIKDAFNNTASYSWWNDIPWVELESGRRMFMMWEKLLNKQASFRDHIGSPAKIFRTMLLREFLPDLETLRIGVDPLAVSRQMGDPRFPEVENAASAFEHIIYQYYMVGYENFTTETIDVHPSGWSAGESFWSLPASAQEHYLKVVDPLWIAFQAGRQLNYYPPHGSAYFCFQTDRILNPSGVYETRPL